MIYNEKQILMYLYSRHMVLNEAGGNSMAEVNEIIKAY